ncbi:hypothetical protein AB0A05_17305 [Streptomyces sp. NPDC046374]|uniref:hypothetical protein n=1 Tax=unclassified Streptomyces TaxID=2593676 RepID=UPI0033E03F0E
MTSPWTPLPDAHPLGGMRPVLEASDAVLGHEPRGGYEDRCWVLHTVHDGDRRLRWHEILAGASRPPLAEWPKTPSYLLFEGIEGRDTWDGPSDGEIDRACLERLVTLLARHGADGPDTPCYAAQAPIEDLGTSAPARAGRLADAPAHHDHCSGRSGEAWLQFPANWWAVDGSWFVLTDWDLCATEVFGPAGLIAALLADEELEAVRHPSIAETWARD